LLLYFVCNAQNQMLKSLRCAQALSSGIGPKKISSTDPRWSWSSSS